MDPVVAAIIAIVELIVSAAVVLVLNKRVNMLIIDSGIASVIATFLMLVFITHVFIGPV